MTNDVEPVVDRAPAGPDPRRWKALVLLCTANFMVILDSQIVILAVPSIEAHISFGPGAVQWVLSAYLLTFGCLLLLGGRLADLLGRRRVFVAGTAVFLVSSLLCGFAWDGGSLIGGRILQGVSAALMAPAALAILMNTFRDGTERNKALAIWSGTGGVGATAALLVGGVLTDGLGWAWIFFINVPIAALLMVLSLRILNESRERDSARSYDVPGVLTITLALVLVVYAIVTVPSAGWMSVHTLGLFVGALVLFGAFVVIERRSAAPLMPPRIFRSRSMVSGNLIMLLMAMLGSGMSFTMSLYAQHVLGYSALVFGLSTAVMPVMAVAGALSGQALVTKVGAWPVAAVGMFLLGGGCLLFTQVSPERGYFASLLPGLVLFGLGLGAATVGGQIAALTGVLKKDAGLASGINTAAFQIGLALGVSVVSAVALSYSVGVGKEGLTSGLRAAFTACVVFATLGVLVALLLMRVSKRRQARAAAVEPVLD